MKRLERRKKRGIVLDKDSIFRHGGLQKVEALVVVCV